MADTEVLNSAVKALVDRLERTEKFVLEQAPDICQQVVTEFKLQNFGQMFIGVILLLIAAVAIPVSIHNRPWFVGHYDQDVTWSFGLLMAGLAALVIGLPVLWSALYYYFYVSKCTKLFLLREFRKLLK